jgi:septum site-determining protein MinC
MRDLVSIKGGREGLRVQLDERADWQAVLRALRTHLEQGGTAFFAGARLQIDVGDRELDEPQLAEILELMAQHSIQPDALAATTRASRNAARAAGLRARVGIPEEAAAPPILPESEAMLISRTVRSGQVVRHQGHITLVGDVNPGAEIIAGGSVVVWGRLRGMVHAGALGDGNAVICALELRPTQLRIGNLIARTPEENERRNTLPEVARIDHDQERIVVEAWEHYRR